LFVRKEEKQRAEVALAQFSDVKVISLEDIVFPWKWNWTGQRPDNALE